MASGRRSSPRIGTSCGEIASYTAEIKNQCGDQGFFSSLLASDRGDLSASEKDLLTEWDAKKKQPQFLKLGDKITKYQALLGRDAGTPMGEEADLRVARVVALAKDLRNPLVHPRPRSELRESEPGRYAFVGDLAFDHVRELVLDVLAVIQAFETSVAGDTRGIAMWFPSLGADGRFGEEVFH